MEKIIADLEDFEMPEEKVEPEKDEYTKECIIKKELKPNKEWKIEEILKMMNVR